MLHNFTMFFIQVCFLEITQNFLLSVTGFESFVKVSSDRSDKLECSLRSTVTTSEIKKLGKLTEFDRDGEVWAVYFVSLDKGKPSLVFSFFCSQTKQNELSPFLRFLKYRKWLLQVILCKKLLFLHQLTNNMTTDCSFNYKFNT